MQIIVFDDDPTGSQTVSDCLLLLRWDKDNLAAALKHHSPLFFLLANTRSLPPDLATARTRELCKSVIQAALSEGLLLEEIFFVSRGDSTLRGHGVLEPAIINEELGPFDATIHVPAFFEGGRTTVNGIHLLNGSPVHNTPFAKDRTFGYSTSDLALWLEEKSKGHIAAQNVGRLTSEILDAAFDSRIGMKKLEEWLLDLVGNKPVVVDAEFPSHLAVLGEAVRSLRGQKRFLFRSAASLINGLANIPTKSCDQGALSSLRLKSNSGEFKPGLVTVGSYVPLADEQLDLLLKNPSCEGIELSVQKIERVLAGELPNQKLFDWEIKWIDQLNAILASGKTPVLFSSRGELPFATAQARVNFGNSLAELMARLVAQVSAQLGYVISKGGITTHVLLEKGLKVNLVNLKGQLLPGLSIVCADTYMEAKGLPVVTFPGNLGEKETLLTAWKLMENNI